VKTVALILACLPLFPTASIAAQPAPWTLGERNGRSCLLTPDGKAFVMLGISHGVMALTEGGALSLSHDEIIEKTAAYMKQQLDKSSPK
jgi:hypothetical protein